MEAKHASRGRRVRYLRPAEVAALRPPEWLLEGFIPEGGLTVLYGAPKTGKSMLTLGWTLSIERGTPWYNRKVKQGCVLYVAGEGLLGIGNRMAAWEREHGELPHDGPIFRDPIVDLLGLGGPEHMLRELREEKIQPRLIVVDTLAKAMVGGDENSAEDMGRAVDGADRLRHETGAAVLLLHHTTKSSDRTMRGSSALLGAADVVLGLTKQKDGAITLRVDAARDFESGEEFDLRMMQSGNSALLVPALGYEPEGLTDEQVEALKALAGCTELGTDATRTQWKDATGLAEAAFVRMVASLERYVDRETAGRVAYFLVNDRGYEMLDRVAHEGPTTLYDEWDDPWSDPDLWEDDQ